MLKHEVESKTSSNSVELPTQEAAQETDLTSGAGPIAANSAVHNRQIKNRVRSRKKSSHKIMLGAFIASLVLGVPLSLLGMMFAPSGFLFIFILFGAVATLAGLIGTPLTLIMMHLSSTHSSAGEPMPPEMGIFAIGPLLDRMTTDVASTSTIRNRLTGLLPQLTANDSSLLENRHYKQLNIYLQRTAWEYNTVRENERDYLLAVLTSYSCVGDPRAIRHVERIAKGLANTKVRDNEVRAAAQRCLAHLTEAATQLNHHNTLLRSAQIESPIGDLLRPVSSAADVDPEQLMRSIASDTQIEKRD